MDPPCANCGKEGAKKRCGKCQKIYYCHQECQKEDWPEHRVSCGVDARLWFQENKQLVRAEDFEVIKKLGEGNFTEVYKVQHRLFPQQYFALKICKLQKVQSMRRETDIILEKHSLNRLKEAYPEEMPCVELY
jgi:serine/threonine protein kinase